MLTRIFSNLRLRVLVLITLAMLPSLGLLLVAVRDQRDQAIEAATLEARRLASLAAADQGRQIESTQQLLTILARLPEVRSGDESCDTLLADLLTRFPRYLNIGVIAAGCLSTVSSFSATAPTFSRRFRPRILRSANTKSGGSRISRH